MNALKLISAIALSGFLLAACGSGGKEWEGDVAFKVTRLNPSQDSMGRTEPPYANLEIDQDEPKSLEPISTRIANLDQLPDGVRVGDRVTCKVKQSDQSGFDQRGVQTTVTSCRSR
ncbi:hypothetical protein [Saccharothrix obliqua]|uniref:hypothetical protein n=1 Tax=Saccharothrix obliqua TaxID=2861747 RepID=UPI001C5CFEF5|nr:hypothetical protein [Saccharothrix obliqua]MBW4715703.1 hypothetical protein [Saccharothrix obliqua]